MTKAASLVAQAKRPSSGPAITAGFRTVKRVPYSACPCGCAPPGTPATPTRWPTCSLTTARTWWSSSSPRATRLPCSTPGLRRPTRRSRGTRRVRRRRTSATQSGSPKAIHSGVNVVYHLAAVVGVDPDRPAGREDDPAQLPARRTWHVGPGIHHVPRHRADAGRARPRTRGAGHGPGIHEPGGVRADGRRRGDHRQLDPGRVRPAGHARTRRRARRGRGATGNRCRGGNP